MSSLCPRRNGQLKTWVLKKRGLWTTKAKESLFMKWIRAQDFLNSQTIVKFHPVIYLIEYLNTDGSYFGIEIEVPATLSTFFEIHWAKNKAFLGATLLSFRAYNKLDYKIEGCHCFCVENWFDVAELKIINVKFHLFLVLFHLLTSGSHLTRRVLPLKSTEGHRETLLFRYSIFLFKRLV